MKLASISFGLALTASVALAQVPYPGNDADNGVARPAGFWDPYTGNISFDTRDLIVSGAVGQNGLAWTRHASSRTPGNEHLFGYGHNWTHSYQTELVDAGKDSFGRPVISLYTATGWAYRFTETSEGIWAAAPGVSQQLVSDGEAFTVLRSNAGNEMHFLRQHTARGDVFELHQIVDLAGNAVTLTWQGGHLVQVTEPAGRWLKVEYATFSTQNTASTLPPYTVISRVVASDGQEVSYRYDFRPDYPVLTSVTYPDGTVASYTYEVTRPGDRSLLVQTSDPHGGSLVRGRKFQYRNETAAAQGQGLAVTELAGGSVIQAVSANAKNNRGYTVQEDNGAVTYRTFNIGGNLAEHIDALGSVKTFNFDAAGRGRGTAITDELGYVVRYEYDTMGNVIRHINSDNTVRSWVKDAAGRVLSETDELGNTRQFIRDARGRVIEILYPDGASETTSYNDYGQMLAYKDRGNAVTTSTYDKRGLCSKVTDALGYSDSRVYDERDHLIAITDARGNTTRYERDAAGRVARTIYADGASTTVAYNDFGQLIKNTDALGISATNVYDDFGRLTSSFDALGHETLTEYAEVGAGVAPLGRPVKTTLPSGRATATAYDSNGRAVARTTAAGTRSAVTARTAYDAAGRLTSVVDPQGNSTQYVYNERGRRTMVINALNYATTYSYDATEHKRSATDAKGNTTKWTYDIFGRELTKTDAKGNVIVRTYDIAGRLATLTGPNGNVYQFEYDLAGRPTLLLYPDGTCEASAYDAVGNKVNYTNRAGAMQSLVYDSRNREIVSEWSDGSQKMIKSYDLAGRMTTEDNGVSNLSYRFNTIGQLISETQDLSPVVTDGAVDPVAGAIGYTYTADGHRETLEYIDGSSVKYSYNPRGQLESILGDRMPLATANYEYDDAGNAARISRKNQTTTLLAHDSNNHVTTVSDLAPKHGMLSEVDYSYDEVGNRMTADTALPTLLDQGAEKQNARDSYQYDQTQQVTAADYGATTNPGAQNAGSPQNIERFTYDAEGNRVAVSEDTNVTHYSVNALNQYIKIGDLSPSYDRNGNLVSMKQWHYRYDALNRLIEATDGRMMAKFYYDAKNRCVARSFNGATTLNYYDNWNLIEEHDVNNSQVGRYVYGRKTDEIVVMNNHFGTFYPHHDALGNVSMLTNSSGALVERYHYTVAGGVSIVDAAGNTLDASSVGNRWLFTGREWIKEIGLYDYRNRVYSAALGRFLQTDPIRFKAGDINIYRYVANNYPNAKDPDGRLLIGAVVDGVIGTVSGILGTLAQGGTTEQALLNGALGGIAGVAIGLCDFSEGVMTGAAVGAGTGGLVNAITQGITYYTEHDTTEGMIDSLSWVGSEGIVGSAVSGLMGGGVGNFSSLSILLTSVDLWEAELVGSTLGGMTDLSFNLLYDDSFNSYTNTTFGQWASYYTSDDYYNFTWE